MLNSISTHVALFLSSESCKIGLVQKQQSTYKCITKQPQLHILRKAIVLSQIQFSNTFQMRFNATLLQSQSLQQFQIKISLKNLNFTFKLNYFLIIIKSQQIQQYIDLVCLEYYQHPLNNTNSYEKEKSQITENINRINLIENFIFKRNYEKLIYVPFLTSFQTIQSDTNHIDALKNQYLNIVFQMHRQQNIVSFALDKTYQKYLKHLKAISLVVLNTQIFINRINKFHLQFQLSNLSILDQNIYVKQMYVPLSKQLTNCVTGLQSMKVKINQNINFKLQVNPLEKQSPLILLQHVSTLHYESSFQGKTTYTNICFNLLFLQESQNFINAQNYANLSTSSTINRRQLLNQFQDTNKLLYFGNISLLLSLPDTNIDENSLAPIVRGGNCSTGYGWVVGGPCTPCNQMGWGCQADCDFNGCTSCSVNYNLGTNANNKTVCACSLSAYNIAQCISCGPPDKCVVCNRGFYVQPINRDTCLPCPNLTNCYRCISPQICSNCDSGFVQDNITQSNWSICTPCPTLISGCTASGCTNYQLCANCQSGYYQKLNSPGNQSCQFCNVTIPDCNTCTTSLMCDTCKTNFTTVNFLDGVGNLIQRQCVDCSILITDCVACTSNTLCTVCITGYNFNASSVKCECVPNNFGLVNCTVCTNSTFCTACISGAILLPGGICRFCTPSDIHLNCTTCSNMSLCTNCQSTYVLDTLTDQYNISCIECIVAIPGCKQLKCTTQTKCSECYSTHYIKYINSTDQPCQFCNVSLGNPCLLCSNHTTCTLCMVSYYLDTILPGNVVCGLCSDVISRCNNCSDPFTCFNCSDNFFLYYSTSLNRILCRRCDSQFLNCQNCTASVCFQCINPYAFSSANICQDCQAGYEKIGANCFKYPGCLTTVIKNGVQICLSCATWLGFIYNPTTKKCVCDVGFKQFYQPGFLMKCLSVCGDGIFLPAYEQCDDHNLISGDGCNSLCQEQPNFQCAGSPLSVCVLHVDFDTFTFNYVFRIAGEHKGILSYTIAPANIGLKLIKWQKLLTLNFSTSAVNPSSLRYSYDWQTGQLRVEFTYMQEMQNVILQSNLTFDPSIVVSNPANLIRSDKLNGINLPLLLESQDFLTMLRNLNLISFIYVILVLLQFYISSLSHKMIGLQTIHVIQMVYFLRMLGDENSKNVPSSINSVKYATTGYANAQLLFEQSQSNVLEQYSTLPGPFLQIQLQKYLLSNINLSILILALIYLTYAIALIRKNCKRAQYMQKLDLEYKDTFTLLKRSAQWTYDHFVFPYTMMINAVVFFNTLAYLQASQGQASGDNQTTLAILSFPTHIVLLLITSAIYSFEVIDSYNQYVKYRMTEKQRNNTPKSLVQKVEHDENYIDRANYHPFYVFIELIKYTFDWIILTLGVFIQSFKISLQILLAFNIIYFLIIFKWKPYFSQIKIHNYFLLLNHGTIILFLINCVIFDKISTKNNKTYLISMYVILFLLVLTTIGGFIRLFFQRIYRVKLQQKGMQLYNIEQINQAQSDKEGRISLTKCKGSNSNNAPPLLNKSDLLVENNPFLFRNQLNLMKKQHTYHELQQQQRNRTQKNGNGVGQQIKLDCNQLLINKIREEYAKKRDRAHFQKGKDQPITI